MTFYIEYWAYKYIDQYKQHKHSNPVGFLRRVAFGNP